MGKPYSEDLRKRVVAAVETGGLSCNQAAKQFGVRRTSTSLIAKGPGRRIAAAASRKDAGNAFVAHARATAA